MAPGCPQFRILYVIDNATREQLAACLVQYELERRGCIVRFASRYVISTAFNTFRPDLVVLPKIHKIPELADLSKRCHVALLGAESFTGSAQTIVLTYTGFQNDNDAVDIRFCWGGFDKSVLTEYKLFSAEKLVVTGHPMTEAWYMPPIRLTPGSLPVIGIASTIKVLANAFGDRNVVSLIDGLENNTDADGESIYFDSPYHAEWWIAFEAAFIRLMVNIADQFPDLEIRLRPHPTERASDYVALTLNRPNVRVSEGGDIADWLEGIDVLLSFISTSQIDASVRGKRVISLKNLFPDWVMSGLPKRLRLAIDDMFDAPSSFEELRAMLSAPYAPPQAVGAYVKEVFNFPSDKRPSEQIADQLFAYLNRCEKKPLAGQPMPTSKLRKLFAFPGADAVLMAALDIKSSLSRSNGGVAHSYCPHRFRRNKNIAERARKLRESVALAAKEALSDE